MRPASLPDPEALAERHPHGTRVRYVAGRCRCEPCREANRAYARLRGKLSADDWNGLVSAARARRHLKRLQAAGVGKRQIADIARVPRSSLGAIARGAKLQIRALSERRILAVTAEALTDASLVRALETRARLAELVDEGFTRTDLARRLGSTAKVPALQIAKRDRVTARTAARVARLHRELTS